MNSDLHPLAAAYALDAVDPDERAAFEQHLVECRTCTAEVAEFRAAAAHLGVATEVAPGPGLKARVLAEATVTRQAAPRAIDFAARRRQWERPLLAAAACLLLVGGVALGRQLIGGSDRDGSGGGLAVGVLDAPDAVVVELAVPDTVTGVDGTVQVVYSAREQAAVVIGSGLSDAGDGNAYEMWLVEGDAVTSAGVFEPANGGVRAGFDLSDQNPNPDAWAITIEPDNGTPTPEGEIIYLGNSTTT